MTALLRYLRFPSGQDTGHCLRCSRHRRRRPGVPGGAWIPSARWSGARFFNWPTRL